MTEEMNLVYLWWEKMCLWVCPLWEKNGSDAIAIIISGIVSVGVSYYFYNKSNRNNFELSVISPIHETLTFDETYKHYIEISKLSKSYSMRYAHKKERKIIIQLERAYKDICTYNVERVCAEMLSSYFEACLQKNEILPDDIPDIDQEGEILGFHQEFLHNTQNPEGYIHLKDELIKILHRYDIWMEDEYGQVLDEERCAKEVVQLFNYCCELNYNGKKIEYFRDFPLSEVLIVSKIRKQWSDKFDNFEYTKTQFSKLAIVKRIASI